MRGVDAQPALDPWARREFVIPLRLGMVLPVSGRVFPESCLQGLGGVGGSLILTWLPF
jgi:hypothetical protein